MKYQLRHAVWEITYRCNMQCKHCGSGCGTPLKDELSTDEALKLCDDLGKLDLYLMTLSGGEPFLRDDWHIIAKRLTDNGVKVNCISNGWYIDKTLLQKAEAAGILNIGVSIDGVRGTHDFMRKKGSFDRAMSSLDLMRSRGMPTVVCTTINKKNLKELAELRKLLVERGVDRWQFQIGRPMGNLVEHPELVIEPEDIAEIVEFCHAAMVDKGMRIDLTDDIGYYSSKDISLRKQSNSESDGIWRGCRAGKSVVGIRANGSVSGCLSIRDENYIEGNVREMSFFELWTRPGAFAWNREEADKALTGFCGECQYGSICRGGCAGAKLTMHQNTNCNDYCLFSVTAKREIVRASSIGNSKELIRRARELISTEDYQLASFHLKRALEIKEDDHTARKLLGYTYYFMGSYEDARACNQAVLKERPEDQYALHGYGMCLEKLGRLDDAIKYLNKAISFAEDDNPEPNKDLAKILHANGRHQDAKLFEKEKTIFV